MVKHGRATLMDVGTGSCSCLAFLSLLDLARFFPNTKFKLFCVVVSLKHGASAFFERKLITVKEMCNLSESVNYVYPICSYLLRQYLYICLSDEDMKAMWLAFCQ